MTDEYRQWIEANWPNEKQKIMELWVERAKLQERIVEIETELLKFAPMNYDKPLSWHQK